MLITKIVNWLIIAPLNEMNKNSFSYNQ